jgi:hypothetical protein
LCADLLQYNPKGHYNDVFIAFVKYVHIEDGKFVTDDPYVHIFSPQNPNYHAFECGPRWTVLGFLTCEALSCGFWRIYQFLAMLSLGLVRRGVAGWGEKAGHIMFRTID